MQASQMRPVGQEHARPASTKARPIASLHTPVTTSSLQARCLAPPLHVPIQQQQLQAQLPQRGSGRCFAGPAKASTPAKEAPSDPTPQGTSKVVCIGEALFDLIADQQGLPRDKVESWTAFAGGAPANVATSLAKLGVPTTFVSALGTDERGQELFDLCKKSNVRMHAVQRLPMHPTRDVYVTRDNDGDREFAGFGRPTEEYSDCFLDAAQLPVDDIKNATVMVTGTLGLAYPATREALFKAAEIIESGRSEAGASAATSQVNDVAGGTASAGTASAPTTTAASGGSLSAPDVTAAEVASSTSGSKCALIVDVNWRPVFWKDPDEARKVVMEYLSKASLIKISDSDLEWLLGMKPEQALKDPCSVAAKFPNAVGILMTAGGEGGAYCMQSGAKGSTSGFVPAFKVDTIDTTGAGDAFTAGFVYKLLEAGSLHELTADPAKLKAALVFAAAAGALTTTKKGAIEGQPKLPEVKELYEQSKSWPNFW